MMQLLTNLRISSALACVDLRHTGIVNTQEFVERCYLGNLFWLALSFLFHHKQIDGASWEGLVDLRHFITL
jgi:hypothetical protein